MPDETWKPIPGHKGYEASSLGRVRSVLRTLTDGRAAGGTVLTPTDDKDGYPRVRLGRRLVGVHVAVCLAFHGKAEVRHLDGDRRNAVPSNLAWGTHAENERDKKEQKRRKREKLGHTPLLIPTHLGH